MSKYEAVYFVGDNQAINRVRIDSSKTRNRGAFSGSLAALINIAGKGLVCLRMKILQIRSLHALIYDKRLAHSIKDLLRRLSGNPPRRTTVTMHICSLILMRQVR